MKLGSMFILEQIVLNVNINMIISSKMKIILSFSLRLAKLKIALINRVIDMVDSNQIGIQLKALRKEKNLTTQELADKVNISQSYISRFENGRAIPDIVMLERILIALDTDLSTFFSSEIQDIPNDLIALMNTAKSLSPQARKKLNEFLKMLIKD